jgi:hypothetical protein
MVWIKGFGFKDFIAGLSSIKPGGVLSQTGSQGL